MRSKNRFRFSLKTALILVGVMCVVGGLFVDRVRRQQNAIAHILDKGGGVAYSFNRSSRSSWPPAWMTQSGVRDYFFRVYAFGVLDSPSFVDSDLDVLQDLPHLVQVTLDGHQFTDHALDYLAKVARLRKLSISNTRIGDAGLERLTELEALEYLDISNSRITPGGRELLQQELGACKIVP